MSEYITHSRAETVALGARMAAVLAPGSLVAFTGGLGAGKTAFTEGLAEGLGCTDPVSSPTFAIVNYYRGPKPLAHFDLYRISTENDLCAAGFYDYLDQGAIVAAEWSENFADLLALENPIRVDIQRVDENTRRITIEGHPHNQANTHIRSGTHPQMTFRSLQLVRQVHLQKLHLHLHALDLPQNAAHYTIKH